MSGSSKKPQILARNLVASSRLFKIESLDLRFSNGVERCYERLVPGGRGAVMMVAMLKDDQFAVIREYGGGVEDYTLTLPKGAVDPGETMRQACHRELQEEIGYGAKRFTWLKKLSLSPSYMSGGIDLILAEDLYPSQLEGDEPEPLELIPWSIHDIPELISRNDCNEGRVVAALSIVQMHKAGQFEGVVLDD